MITAIEANNKANDALELINNKVKQQVQEMVESASVEIDTAVNNGEHETFHNYISSQPNFIISLVINMFQDEMENYGYYCFWNGREFIIQWKIKESV